MAAVIVGGVTIKVEPDGVSRDRIDNVDRGRAFDNTYRASQSGTVKHDFHFSTPFVARATGDTYEATLGVVSPQTCSGDIIGSSVSCCSMITGRVFKPTSATTHLVKLSFILSEV